MDNNIIEKLADLANPKAMTSKDFIKNYKIVISHVVEMKKILSKLADKLIFDFNKNKTDIQKSAIVEVDKIKKNGDEVMANITNKLDDIDKRIDKRLSEIKDGVDGKDGKDGANGINADEETIVNKLVDKIKFTSIKEEIEDIKEMMKEYEEKLLSVKRVRGGGTGGNNQAVQYADLTAQCDGVLKTFTIPTARKIVALQGTQYPIIYRPIIDYTVGNRTITLTAEVSAPESGQTLTLLYIK